MKILLDENLPEDLRFSLTGYVVHTASWAGSRGLRDDDLIEFAEKAGYSVLLMNDEGVPCLQHIPGNRLSIVSIKAPTMSLRDILPLVGQIQKTITLLQPGQTICVE